MKFQFRIVLFASPLCGVCTVEESITATRPKGISQGRIFRIRKRVAQQSHARCQISAIGFINERNCPTARFGRENQPQPVAFEHPVVRTVAIEIEAIAPNCVLRQLQERDGNRPLVTPRAEFHCSVQQTIRVGRQCHRIRSRWPQDHFSYGALLLWHRKAVAAAQRTCDGNIHAARLLGIVIHAGKQNDGRLVGHDCHQRRIGPQKCIGAHGQRQRIPHHVFEFARCGFAGLFDFGDVRRVRQIHTQDAQEIWSGTTWNRDIQFLGENSPMRLRNGRPLECHMRRVLGQMQQYIRARGNIKRQLQHFSIPLYTQQFRAGGFHSIRARHNWCARRIRRGRRAQRLFERQQ